jgi:prolyl 4-hydroxylase
VSASRLLIALAHPAADDDDELSCSRSRRWPLIVNRLDSLRTLETDQSPPPATAGDLAAAAHLRLSCTMLSRATTNRMPEPQAKGGNTAALSSSNKSASFASPKKRTVLSSAAAASPAHKKTKREAPFSEQTGEDDDSADGSGDEDSEDAMPACVESKDATPPKSSLHPAVKSQPAISSRSGASLSSSSAASPQKAAASAALSDADPSSTANPVTSPSDIPSKNPIQLRLIEDFLTAAECRRLIAIGETDGFQRSMVAGILPIVVPGRTSFTSYAPDTDPIREVILQRLRERIFEFGQQKFGTAELALVRYEPGQQYKQHYDSRLADGDRKKQYTIFVYLNDVESGGETWFPRLSLRVKPRRGAALVWENHTDRYTEMHDGALHAGLPPTKGVKVSRVSVSERDAVDPKRSIADAPADVSRLLHPRLAVRSQPLAEISCHLVYDRLTLTSCSHPRHRQRRRRPLAAARWSSRARKFSLWQPQHSSARHASDDSL